MPSETSASQVVLEAAAGVKKIGSVDNASSKE